MTIRWHRDFWFYGRIDGANLFLVIDLHRVVKIGIIYPLTSSRKIAFGLFDMFQSFTLVFPNLSVSYEYRILVVSAQYFVLPVTEWYALISR